MFLDKRIVVIMPAFNASRTLEQTVRDIPDGVIDEIIVIDDASDDGTVNIAKRLGVRVIAHPRNIGYGGAQKSGYRKALEIGADIVIMVHPDYQYSPGLVPAMASMVASGHYDMVLGSRISGGGALKGGMPLYKYLANRFLTCVENMALGIRLSEYHTGYRAYSRRLLETIPYERNSDGFLFDNEVIVQAVAFGCPIGEISCPTRYFPEASSIGLIESIRYGLGVLWTTVKYLLHKAGLLSAGLFREDTPREYSDREETLKTDK
jgi:glycosyltransferase involved in cell wall biosynthesis